MADLTLQGWLKKNLLGNKTVSEAFSFWKKLPKNAQEAKWGVVVVWLQPAG